MRSNQLSYEPTSRNELGDDDQSFSKNGPFFRKSLPCQGSGSTETKGAGLQVVDVAFNRLGNFGAAQSESGDDGQQIHSLISGAEICLPESVDSYPIERDRVYAAAQKVAEADRQWVYFLLSPSLGRVKIGLTWRLKQRI